MRHTRNNFTKDTKPYMDSFIHRMIDAIDKRGPLPLIIDRDLIR